MSQVDVYAWLRAQRERGKNTYYSAKEIQEALGPSVSLGARWNVLSDCLSLERHGYLEAELKGSLLKPIRIFRIKEKYVGQN